MISLSVSFFPLFVVVVVGGGFCVVLWWVGCERREKRKREKLKKGERIITWRTERGRGDRWMDARGLDNRNKEERQ